MNKSIVSLCSFACSLFYYLFICLFVLKGGFSICNIHGGQNVSQFLHALGISCFIVIPGINFDHCVRIIFLRTIFLFYENACMNQKQLTPSRRSEVMYTKYKIRKVKEFMQGINVYTSIQSSKNIQRENSFSTRYTKGTELHLEYTKNTQYFIVSCNEYQSEGKQLTEKYP